MKQYLMSLQPRERYTLLSGAVVLLLLLVYLLLVEPFVLELDRLEKSVAAQQQELAWMQGSVAQVKKLRTEDAGSGGPRAETGQSLLSLVDTTARELGLGAALKQLSPVGEKVRVRLERASFDSMLRWLGRLEQQAGVGVDTLTLERLPEPGMINATVVLRQGEGV